MAYTVLARRYRSTSFDEVVGQEPIARTLRNAIEHGRVAHAYLFTGTRGVGKTSMARIFAKALNAVGDDGVEKADVAAAVMQGRDTDVIEIDGASNNRVEEARELIAGSVYRPMRGRYKIYIIDEVHMLSTAAFNALLKTMEEPPEHVVFILCTTEAHKVPATIQSRCQRFDFRNISTVKIAEHLAQVIAKEGLEAEPELIQLVARLGNGSMRDALSLLDRVMATGQKVLTAGLLEELLGLPDRLAVTRLIASVADGDAGGALVAADALLDKGIWVEQVLATLTERFRDLMVLNACGPETALVELAGEQRREAGELASRFDAAALSHMIAVCEGAARGAKGASSPRAVLDATIVRLAMTEKVAEVNTLLLASAAGGGVGLVGGGGGGAVKKR